MSAELSDTDTTSRAWRVLCVTAADWGLPPPVQEGGRLLRRRAPQPLLSRRRRRSHERLQTPTLWSTGAASHWPLPGLAW
ncbi:hypothetical protein [Curvibacter gracilis]|uniref:hypothetical protein n=1 Tax=Curvibacter gracilis TaxID=230310 RepID=UPI0012F7B7E1|nr:hypothetical protein [Curvibacter gracilis]